MTEEFKTFRNEISYIFRKASSDKIESFDITKDNYKKYQKDILNLYRDEQNLSAFKVYEISLDKNPVNLDSLKDQLLSMEHTQDFLINNQIDNYSIFPLADKASHAFEVGFAGFTYFEVESINEFNAPVVENVKSFNIFIAKFFKHPSSTKTYMFLNFSNRRRFRNQINFFENETVLVRNWLTNLFKIKMAAIDVKEIYQKHPFDKKKFEHTGYNVRDITAINETTLPVDLKFRQNDRSLRPEDVYTEVNKVVFDDIFNVILDIITKTIQEPDEATREKLNNEIKNANLSKLFFESAYRAFENGVGHLKYLEKIGSYDKPITYRLDFPADDAGVIKVETPNGGHLMKPMYDEVIRYLAKR